MKANKMVIGNIASIFLILAWSAVPPILKNDKLWDTTWYEIVWIVLFFVPIILPFVFIAVALGGVGAIFGGQGRRGRKILSDGRPAAAEILEIGENSGGGYLSIDDQPVVNLKLRVYDGDKAPYDVSLDTVIPRLEVPQFQPGTRIHIKIDPLDPKKVAIDTGWRPEKPVYGNDYSPERMKRLQTKGKKGTAKVIAVEDTGKSGDADPIVKVTLEVSGPGIEKYSVSREVPVPAKLAAMFFPGKTYPCLVDPEDPEAVLLLAELGVPPDIKI